MLNGFDEVIRLNIRALRERSGITQEQAGRLLGVTFQQFQKYECGKNRISAGKLPILAKAFGVNVAAFFQGTLEGFAMKECSKIDSRGAKAFSTVKEDDMKEGLIALMYTMH